MRTKRIVTIALAALALSGGVALASTSAQATGTSVAVGCTATTQVSNDLDSGNHGDWATDNFTRVTKVSKAAGGWKVTITDTGTFTTKPGGPAPETGTPLPNKAFTGSFTGVDNFLVHTTDLPDCSNVPATINGSPHTSAWPQRVFGDISADCWTQGSWSWTYTIGCADLKLDGNGTVSWVNSSDGDQGNITALLLLALKTHKCTCPPTVSPSPSSPSPSPASPSPSSPSPSSSSSVGSSPSQSSTTSSSPLPITNVGNSSTSGSLPVTGTNLGIIFAVGAVLILAGGGTLFFMRRKHANN